MLLRRHSDFAERARVAVVLRTRVWNPCAKRPEGGRAQNPPDPSWHSDRAVLATSTRRHSLTGNAMRGGPPAVGKDPRSPRLDRQMHAPRWSTRPRKSTLLDASSVSFLPGGGYLGGAQHAGGAQGVSSRPKVHHDSTRSNYGVQVLRMFDLDVRTRSRDHSTGFRPAGEIFALLPCQISKGRFRGS